MQPQEEIELGRKLRSYFITAMHAISRNIFVCVYNVHYHKYNHIYPLLKKNGARVRTGAKFYSIQTLDTHYVVFLAPNKVQNCFRN